MPQPPKKDARLTLRITSDSKRELQSAANRRDRSLNWLVQDIFNRWLVKERSRRSR